MKVTTAKVVTLNEGKIKGQGGVGEGISFG